MDDPQNPQVIDIDAILPISWPRVRLLAALRAKKAESRIYGPIDRVLNDFFPARRPHTQHEGWVLKPQPSLRERQAGVELSQRSNSDTEDEDEPERAQEDVATYEVGEGDTSVGNITIDSQFNPVQPDRRKAKRPDFVVAKGTASLTGDVHHLYIEIKNGSTTETQFLDQMAKYLRLAARAIPPAMTLPVYFMLINGEETFL
ncbi:hypothetical protein FS749_000862 [Ceratobasidium sp. UAMH 11750]|nr:hypothetical protein FS749_000862 [Ceratobasidium sp. UAMH 11750]